MIFRGERRGFTRLPVEPKFVLSTYWESITSPLRVCVVSRPTLESIMRTSCKIIFWFFIAPLSIAAQNHPASAQLDPSVKDNSGGQDLSPASDIVNTTTLSGSEPARVPVLVQSAPAFMFVQPIKARPAVHTAYAPSWNVSAGFSVTSLGLPPSGRAVLSGMNASLSLDTGKHYGAKLDFGYQRVPNLNNTGQPMSLLNYLVGPVVYPTNGDQLSTYVHALIGGARVGGPFPNGAGGLTIGFVNSPAWAFGGGAEYRVSQAFGFRVGFDYLHTHFYNSAGAVRGQNDIRIVSSFVYYLGNPIRGD